MQVPYNDKRNAIPKGKQKSYKNKKIREEKLKSCIFYERERDLPLIIDLLMNYWGIFNLFIHIFTCYLYLFPTVPDVQHEPWFGSLYTEEDISPFLLEQWTNPPKRDPSLHLPPKNEFIPCDFSIRSANISKNPSEVSLPKCIENQPLLKLWYKADSIFNVPRANTYFLITVKDGYSSIRNCVLTELFVNLLKDELNEVLYQVTYFHTLNPFCFICSHNLWCFILYICS